MCRVKQVLFWQVLPDSLRWLDVARLSHFENSGSVDQRRLLLPLLLFHWKSYGEKGRRLHDMACSAVYSGRSSQVGLLKGDEFQHSQNSTRRSITPPCQNRRPAKDERKAYGCACVSVAGALACNPGHELGQADCKARELVRRVGQWYPLGGRHRFWFAGTWTSGLETIPPNAGRSIRC